VAINKSVVALIFAGILALQVAAVKGQALAEAGHSAKARPPLDTLQFRGKSGREFLGFGEDFGKFLGGVSGGNWDGRLAAK
jgi:hypothetical protein